jgi:hypothetical protein
MKICPKCNQTYADETLNFCLADGSTLSVVNSANVGDQETPTVIRSASPSAKPRMSIKTTLLIFLFLAIPITLFPPYNWGRRDYKRKLIEIDYFVETEALPKNMFYL